MTFLLWHREGDLGIASDRRVLRAAEVPVFHDALALCDRLQVLHTEHATRLEAACEEGRNQGFDAGFTEGASAANEALAERLTQLTAAAQQQRDQLNSQLAALALQVARKLIGSLPEGDRLVALAHTAARELVAGGPMALVVHPEQAEAVGQRLAQVNRNAKSSNPNPDEPIPAFELRTDAALERDTCRIETELGSIDATLDTQLRRIAQAWGVYE